MNPPPDDSRPQLGDPADPAFVECPYPRYAALQRTEPVFGLPGVGAGVTGYDNLIGLSTDNVNLSRQVSAQMARLGVGDNPAGEEVLDLRRELHPESPTLFTSDPPEHTWQRRLVNQAFLPRRVRALAPQLERFAHQLIDGFVADGEVEFVERFAVPFPLGMITDMLGVDRGDMAMMKRWTDEMLAGVSDILDDARRLEVTRSALAFQEYFLERIARRRRAPCEDVLSDLVNAELGDGVRLTDGQLLTIVGQLAVAGHATSTNFLGNGLVLMLNQPEVLAALRRDRSLVASFVEEVLRIDPPLQCTYRRATRDFTVDGIGLHEGETVALFWGAAGYDETVFPEPERFHLDRTNARKHLAFGHGTHFCVGHELARQEGRIAFNALLDRLDDLRLDEPASDLRHHPSFAHHGYRSIVVRFRAR
jgi:cytochrome P450